MCVCGYNKRHGVSRVPWSAGGTEAFLLAFSVVNPTSYANAGERWCVRACPALGGRGRGRGRTCVQLRLLLTASAAGGLVILLLAQAP